MKKFSVAEPPKPDVVLLARKQAGMTQEQAAERVHLSTYRRWAEYERGTYNMDLARWELFLLHTGQHPIYQSLAVKK